MFVFKYGKFISLNTDENPQKQESFASKLLDSLLITKKVKVSTNPEDSGFYTMVSWAHKKYEMRLMKIIVSYT